MLSKFWYDERGDISIEYVILIITIGAIVYNAFKAVGINLGDFIMSLPARLGFL